MLAGMDDMFVLAQAYKREVKQGSSVLSVMGATLGEAGPSVAFTTVINFCKRTLLDHRGWCGSGGDGYPRLLCNDVPTLTLGSGSPVAFMIGSASTVAVVQVFCYQLVISVVFNFLALFALFVPAMILDCSRVMADRPETCISCCNNQDA